MKIPFVGGAYLGRSSYLNPQECQNLYPEVDQQGGKEVLSLRNTPGLRLWNQLTAALAESPVRGLHVMGSDLYAVVGNTVYKIASSDINVDFDPGTITTMSGTLSASTGRVWMEDNGTQLMIVQGSKNGYILSGTTVTLISDADFVTPTSLTYQDGYFIISKVSSGRFHISASYDGTSWAAADYSTAEGDPDDLMVCISSNRELWLLGRTSYEVWYNSGNATFTFERIAGAVNKVGCGAADSAAEQGGILVWLDNRHQIRMREGYGTRVISTPQVDFHIAGYETKNDALGFIYTQEGHTFYVLTFPTERKTWCYDFTTGIWHTRASGTNDDRHRVSCYAYFSGMHIVGDYEYNRLYRYDLAKYTDHGIPIRRIRTAPAVTGDRKRLFHHSLEIDFESGVGLAANDPDIATGTDPQAMLQWSDDGGRTWGNEHWADIGAIGKYQNRATWRRLGSARDRVYKVTVADPVKTVIVNAHLEATSGVS